MQNKFKWPASWLIFMSFFQPEIRPGKIGSNLKFVLPCLICLFWWNCSFGFVYGEHKIIGDRAFALMMRALKNRENPDGLWKYMNRVAISNSSVYSFPALSSQGSSPISYGMLNALAGDHQKDPVLLEEQLKDPASILQKIIVLHQQYIDKGLKAAPDGILLGIDLHYALDAAKNLCHFYAYGKSFQDQLKNFDLEKIGKVCDRASLSALVKSLSSGNAIMMYVSLHLVAIHTAEQGGRMAKTGDQKAAQELLEAALFLNGFADHFLEDSFSAGHLMVNRTVLESFTNNKALHDFYSEYGTTVVNRKGEIWKTYGDGKFEENNEDGIRVIAAVQASLEDLTDAFSNGFASASIGGFLDKIPVQKDLQAIYLIRNIPSLSLIPIPYNSELRELMPKEVVLSAGMQKANQLLYNRNFVRSRVGNSFVFGAVTEMARSVSGFEFRLNAVNFSKKYDFNINGGKKGMLDIWHGYTLSYQITKNREGDHELSSKISGGLRSNFDYWFSDKRFLGLYSYVETGLRFERGSTDVIFAPSLGVHLGSLLNINYYNMPSWLRIPAMYLLPLKVRYGPVFSFRQSPRYYASAEIDVFF